MNAEGQIGLTVKKTEFAEGQQRVDVEPIRREPGHVEQTIPIPAALAEELRLFRARLQDWGDGWLFPQQSKDQPWERPRFDKLLRAAEKAAKLEALPGGLWHPYRRKWASERRHLPAVDVMKAGGWKNRSVMESCYQHADDAGVLEVMSSAVKLRDKKLGGSA